MSQQGKRFVELPTCLLPGALTVRAWFVAPDYIYQEGRKVKKEGYLLDFGGRNERVRGNQIKMCYFFSKFSLSVCILYIPAL